MILPRFHCAFDRPTPATRCSRSTRSGSVDWNDGNVNAPMHPATKLSAAMPSGVAVPPPTHTARIAATTADKRVADHQQPAPAPTIRHRRSDRAEHAVGKEAGRTHDRGPRRLPGRVRDVIAQPDGFHPRADVRQQRTGPHQSEVARSKWSERRRGHARATLPVSLYSAWRPGSRMLACLPDSTVWNPCPQNWHQPSPKTAHCRSSPYPRRFDSGVRGFVSLIAAQCEQPRCSSKRSCSMAPSSRSANRSIVGGAG